MKSISQWILICCIVVFGLLWMQEAQARVFIGGGVVVGQPYYSYPPYYGYPYYAYAPAYPPAPPPPYGYPPAYGYAEPYEVPPPVAADRYYDFGNRYCREYTHTVIIGGAPRHVYGHACREPDGSWRRID